LVATLGVRAENIFDDGWRPAQRPADVREAPSLDAVSGASGAVAGVAKRLPVPASAQLEASRRMLRELYADDLRDASATGRRGLARKLFESARGTADNPADRFALYEGAYRAATAASAAPLCVEAIDALARVYEIDGSWIKADALCRMNPKGLPGADSAALARCGLMVVDELLAAGDVANASRVLTALEGAASRDPDLKRGLQQRKTESTAVRAARERAVAAMKRLAVNPADPGANFEAGWYLCARGREWARGLPLLAKGDKGDLKSLAERDLSGADSSEESAALADAWWEVAERKGMSAGEQASVRAHAARWYRRAQPGATGLLTLKIEQRLVEAGGRQQGGEMGGGTRPPRDDAGGGGVGAEAQNLLVDGSFEDATGRNWRLTSWRKQEGSRVVSLDRRNLREGKASLLLTTDQADDVSVAQKVLVKPNTRYRLSGWIKTEDVRVVEAGGAFGASLSVLGGFEASGSVTGTQDWKRVDVDFKTGNRDSIDVAARLGHIRSTATGRAWFDDLVLVEQQDR
jgi:hypothetical protein